MMYEMPSGTILCGTSGYDVVEYMMFIDSSTVKRNVVEYMDEVAETVHEHSGKTIRTDTADNFIADLTDYSLLKKVKSH